MCGLEKKGVAIKSSNIEGGHGFLLRLLYDTLSILEFIDTFTFQLRPG